MSDRSHRRKLGQNYLVDPVILFEMERAINPQEKNLFFEIGPGTGALTNHLMGNNIQIIAMDLDAKNVKSLADQYSNTKHQFIHGDVLKEPLDFLILLRDGMISSQLSLTNIKGTDCPIIIIMYPLSIFLIYNFFFLKTNPAS